jgi:hypothetical protein
VSRGGVTGSIALIKKRLNKGVQHSLSKHVQTTPDHERETGGSVSARQNACVGPSLDAGWLSPFAEIGRTTDWIGGQIVCSGDTWFQIVMVRPFRFEMPGWRGLPFFGRDGRGSDVMRRFTTSDPARAMARFGGPLNKLFMPSQHLKILSHYLPRRWVLRRSEFLLTPCAPSHARKPQVRR